MTHPQPKAAAGVDKLPSYEEALLDAGKARALFDASKGGNVRGITEDHRFVLANVFAKPAPSIKFVRVARDCPHNDALVQAGDARGFIYDFDVMIDGEHRAQWRRDYTGRGYHLYDADCRPIRRPGEKFPKAVGFEVGSKAEFETTVRGFLEAGQIPTLARMAELRTEDEAKLNARRAEVAEQYRVRHIKAASVQLYDALKTALAALRSGAGIEEKANAARAAEAAIAEAEKTYETDAAQIEYEAKYR